MKKSIIALVLLSLLTGCKEDETGKESPDFYRSLIQTYDTPDSLFVKFDPHYKAYTIFYYPKETIDKNTDEERYDLLCIKNRDTSFNRYINFTSRNSYMETVCAYDFVSVDLVSDADFDPQHPAGTSLADIAEFRTMSPKPYIESGYTKEYPQGIIEDDFLRHNILYKWFWPVHARMSELTPDDLTMMKSDGWGGTGAFRFTRQPTAPGKHDMTLTMTTDEGKVYTAEFAVEFE